MILINFILQEKLLEMERKQREMEMACRQQLEANRQIMKKAAIKEDEPVDIDDIVRGFFDFLPSDTGSDAPAIHSHRTAFGVYKFSFRNFEFDLTNFLNLIRIYRFKIRAI